MLTQTRVAPAGALLGLGYCVRPEALVIALAAAPAIATWRRRALWLAAFSIAALPEVALLSRERGASTFTPKTNLIAASGAARDDAEWRIAGIDTSGSRARPLIERARATLPAAAARYPGRLRGQLERVLQSWPPPLIALSVIGAVRLRGPLMAPLAIVLVLPMLGVTPHLRYPQTLLPALAIFAAAGAAAGAAWLAARFPASDPARRRVAIALAALALIGGLAWCWSGPAGDSVRRFEDGPMPSLRRAGAWLAHNGRPGQAVMDRKPYVPFFAGMRHVLMPDDDYDTIVEHARARGADYLVVEEYVMWGMRRQFVPLMTDPAFRDRERRLRMVFAGDEGPMTGIAVFEVVRTR